jgi:hypothetical protein
MALVLALYPVGLAAAFGMGGTAVGISTGMSVSGAGTMGNGGNASYAHGSPAATNPAVATVEARQRDAQVLGEIDRARKAGSNVAAAQADWRKGEGALEANHPDQAMLDFDHAEREMGIIPHLTVMGAYTRSEFGSVTPGGTELSGAVVH